MSGSLIPAEVIENRILLLRGHKVMLDSDLSMLYGVETRALIQAVKRNLYRFPADFIFKLNNQELMALRSQIVISNAGRGGRRYIQLKKKSQKSDLNQSEDFYLNCERKE